MSNSEKIRALLDKPEFPRGASYDADFMLDGQMGPNAVWLTEWLCRELPLEPGARVLDLGCGRALSSVFLAREFGTQVVAADLWIEPEGNWNRVRAAGCAGQVIPMALEAHHLPFAPGYFDAVVSVDAYHYFGTDDLYLSYLAGFVREGGRIAIVVPGLMGEFDGG
ncbi:methyltransferase domain-containing protein, partial [bacterium]|nr:methyltransferase domain-containing protein [bacterium]